MSIALTNDAPWMIDALCREYPAEMFDDHDERHKPPDDVRRICEMCPVQTACYSYAYADRLSGIWGGTTFYQREQARKSRLKTQRTA